MSNFKKGSLYIAYVLGLGFILNLGFKITQVVEKMRTIEFNPKPFHIYSIVFPVILGLYIALPEFTANSQKQGRWEINWLRLIIVGLPTLYFLINPYLYYYSPLGSVISKLRNFCPFTAVILNKTTHSLGGVLFGYTVLSSIRKSSSSRFFKF